MLLIVFANTAMHKYDLCSFPSATHGFVVGCIMCGFLNGKSTSSTKCRSERLKLEGKVAREWKIKCEEVEEDVFLCSKRYVVDKSEFGDRKRKHTVEDRKVLVREKRSFEG